MATRKHSTTNTAVLEPPAVNPRLGMDFEPHLRAVALSRIDADPANERPDIDYLPEMLGDLMDSMRSIGLQEPVKLFAQPPGNRYRLSSGHRRVAAAQALGWDTILAIVAPPPPAGSTDADVSRIASNLCRKDIDPIALARGIQQLLAAHPDLTQAKVGAMLGKSQSAIANSLRLLTLPDDVLTLIAAGKLSAGHGMELLRIDADELGYDGTPTGRTAAAMIAEKAQRAAREHWSVAAVRSDVTSWMGNQVYCRKNAQQSAEREAAYEAETAALVAAGKDPAAARLAASEAQRAAQTAEWEAKHAADAKLRAVARGVVAAALEADPLGALIVGAIAGLSRLSNGSDELTVWTAFADPAAVVAQLQADAPRAITLNYAGTGLGIYGAADSFAEARWGLNRKIAKALRTADLITEKEYVALCSPKRQPGQETTPAPAVAATPEPPALSNQPRPYGPPCPGCGTLLTIAGAIYHCDEALGGCGCFWAADLSPVDLGDGYAALEAVGTAEAVA